MGHEICTEENSFRSIKECRFNKYMLINMNKNITTQTNYYLHSITDILIQKEGERSG